MATVAMSDDTPSGRVTHTITLTVDGEQIPVQLEEPGSITKLKLASKAQSPMAVQMGQLNQDTIDMLRRSVEEVSDFPPELLDELPHDQFIQLIESVNTVLRGDTPTVDNRDPQSTSSYDDVHDDVFGDDTSLFF